MTPFSMFLALQTQLRETWGLSNTEVGWISSGYYAGYMLAVPVLSSLTDRVDARTVWLWATTLGAIAAVGFGLYANGVFTALAFQVLAGASLAGTYMPGLKLIADRLPSVPHPRSVAYYTTSFTIGASLSFYAIGQLDRIVGWQTAVALAAVGPVAAWLLVYLPLRPVAPVRRAENAGQGQWSAVLRSAPTLKYVLAYACHMWELFGVRAWLVPFLAFCVATRGEAMASPATLAALIGLVGVPASLAGAELSARMDPRRLIVCAMLLASATSVLFGLSSATGWTVILVLAVIYSACISADSAALTAGLVAVAPPASRGTAMALYSMIGFASASAGSAAGGRLLDVLGGESTANWAITFALLGASNLVGVLVLRGAGRPARRLAGS